MESPPSKRQRLQESPWSSLPQSQTTAPSSIIASASCHTRVQDEDYNSIPKLDHYKAVTGDAKDTKEFITFERVPETVLRSTPINGTGEWDASELDRCSVTVGSSDTEHVPESPDHQQMAEEIIKLWDFDNEDLEELLGDESPTEATRPPSSVIRCHERSSRSRDEFDADLQHSSPRPNAAITAISVEDQLLDHDVDWELITEHGQAPPQSTCAITSQATHTLHDISSTRSQVTVANLQPKTLVEANAPDYSMIRMVLRPYKTFFHIQGMLDTKSQIYRNQPEAIFELFARIIYSSRENFAHKQLFQFRDLFKETPPYLNGTLLG
ncbi:hypothetical protein G7046_g9783 [Stylonectria norvegica]|nr:hypothetical protein G7046_g9783 [Stylonectria norvegica]